MKTTQKSKMQSPQLVFSKEDVADAVEEIVRLRLVENWSGCLKLEMKDEEIHISQFAGSNSWTEGHETIYQVNENDDWSDFGDFDEDFMKLTRQERWENVDLSWMLEYQIEQAEELTNEAEN